MKFVKIKIYGRVQGVWFRQSAKQKADELGLGGWVRNEPDGTVLIEIQGTETKLKEFIAWCRKGSEQAKVSRLEIDGHSEIKNFSEFTIE